MAINSEGIIVSKIMTNHLTDDRQCVEPLINQTNDGLITEVIADRGYDSNAIYKLLASKGIKTIIPPPIRISALKAGPITDRDYNLAYIQKKGIYAWYSKNNYRRREKVENLFYRYKTIIGRKLQTRKMGESRCRDAPWLCYVESND